MLQIISTLKTERRPCHPCPRSRHHLLARHCAAAGVLRVMAGDRLLSPGCPCRAISFTRTSIDLRLLPSLSGPFPFADRASNLLAFRQVLHFARLGAPPERDALNPPKLTACLCPGCRRRRTTKQAFHRSRRASQRLPRFPVIVIEFIAFPVKRFRFRVPFRRRVRSAWAHPATTKAGFLIVVQVL